MDLKPIINAVADEADDLLAGVSKKNEARIVLLDYLADNHPDLSPGDSARVASGVLALLDQEGFFEISAGAESWDEGAGEADEG
jgi:monomeric isocitrate dehydrogenase